MFGLLTGNSHRKKLVEKREYGIAAGNGLITVADQIHHLEGTSGVIDPLYFKRNGVSNQETLKLLETYTQFEGFMLEGVQAEYELRQGTKPAWLEREIEELRDEVRGFEAKRVKLEAERDRLWALANEEPQRLSDGSKQKRAQRDLDDVQRRLRELETKRGEVSNKMAALGNRMLEADPQP